jgi:hypothetical protein
VTRSRLIGAAVVIGLAAITAFLYFESVTATGKAQIVGYQHTADIRRIVVIVALARLDDIAEREVQETSDAVRITVHKRTTSGTSTADLIVFPVTVTLRSPLGSRAVLDDKGAPVRDLGTYEMPRPSGSP